MKTICLLFCLVSFLSACALDSSKPALRPESLVNSSAEKVSFPISDEASLLVIENWLATSGAPASAQISCQSGGKLCSKLKKYFRDNKISLQEVAGGDSKSASISLNYVNIVTGECSADSFGCATSLNIVNMASERRQFINPKASSEMHDSSSAVRAVKRYVE
jgi:hypothetical protein